MPMHPTPLAMGQLLGIALGAVVGLCVTVVGVLLLRRIARSGLTGWKHLAPPLLLSGPALGVIVGGMVRDSGFLFGVESHWGVNLAWSVILFFGATSILGVVRAILRSHAVRDELGIQVPDLLLDGARYLLWVVMGFVIVGGVWGKTDWFSALFTASAVGTVIVGFALQETIASFFAGLALITEGIYTIGDWVAIGDMEGRVVKLSRRTTQLLARSGDLVTINNRGVSSATVRNLTRAGTRHAEYVVLSAPYDAPPNKVRQLLQEAALAAQGVLRDPPPLVRLLRYGDSGIDYQVKFFTTELDTLPDVRSDVLVHAWYLFQRAGVSFPYPVREVRRLAPAKDPAVVSSGDLARRLRAMPIFGDLSEDVLPLLASGARVQTHGAGETLVRQGDAGDTCFLIEEGRVAVVVASGSSERKVAELAAGDMFGEMSLLTGEARSATVRTLTDARLIAVGADAIKRLLDASPDLAHHLAESVVRRKEGLTEARAHLDAAAKARVSAETRRVRDLIRACFQQRAG